MSRTRSRGHEEESRQPSPRRSSNHAGGPGDYRPADLRRRYVERVLDLFQSVPGTLRVRRLTDRRLAATLFDRHVPLETVEAAILLTVAKRAARGASQRLPPIASLHYFSPVIDELLEEPLDPDYIHYLRRRVARIAPALLASIEP